MNRVKEVDCALFFMLDEERDLFLKHNEDFIITSKPNGNFIDFIFFDKRMNLRLGVICSGGKKMGNSEAEQLFYCLSRKYKAHLYINLGVAGLIDDMFIGDVLIVDRLSTMGENNANTTDKQIVDIFRQSPTAVSASNDLNNLLIDFDENTKQQVSKFKKQLKDLKVDTSNYTGFDAEFESNKIMIGRCVTVPEVIKDKSKWPEFSKHRKINLIDMEAYYVALWHELIKSNEAENSIPESDFLAFKSVSDYGDDNKQIMEQYGSRNIAMKNLNTAVSTYCTKIYEFKRQTESTVFDYLGKDISELSLDSIIKKTISYENIPVDIFEELFKNISQIKDENVVDMGIVSYAVKKLNEQNQAILLTGRSGTGKSTFLSYLYTIFSGEKNCVLIDFSKFSSETTPTAKQVVSLIEGLMVQNDNYLIFIDGLSVGTEAYDLLKSVLDNNIYSNLGFCIGNIDDDFDDLYDIVSGKNEINEISFYGISVYHPQYNKLIEDSEAFFSFVNKSYNKNTIDKHIRESNLTSVDFRLLTTFANFTGDISTKKNFQTFIKSYLSSKYKESEFNDYWKKTNTLDIVEDKNITKKVERNTYFVALAIANNMIESFSKNDEEQIKVILKRNYVLSDDMNSMFDYTFKSKRQYGKIVKNMVDALNNNDASISTETQLIYNISRTITKENTSFRKFKTLVTNKIASVAEKINDDTNADYYNYIIEYRTLCIVMNSCFNDKTYLADFNKKLLEGNIDFVRCNLSFHLFYYAKRVFDFKILNEFELCQANYEMISNTFYVLKNSLNNLYNKVIAGSPQDILNIITIINLTSVMMNSSNVSTAFIRSSKQYLGEILNTLNTAAPRCKDAPSIQSIIKLIESVLSEEN